MRLVAFGDVHMNCDFLHRIPALSEADLVLVSGDLTTFGHRAEAMEVLVTLRRHNKNILAVAGNLDHPEVEELLAAEGLSLHGRGELRSGLGLFGVGGSNPTPFNTPNEFSEEELATLLEAGHKAVRGQAQHLVLVSHPPPFGTATDRLASGAQVGSRAVRAFIEKTQPALCCTGHIHESRCVDRIGGTTVINPGMLRHGGWIEILFDGTELLATLHS